jgi:hypothetical protein
MANPALVAQLQQLAGKQNTLQQTLRNLQASNTTLTTRITTLGAEKTTLTTANTTLMAQVANQEALWLVALPEEVVQEPPP